MPASPECDPAHERQRDEPEPIDRSDDVFHRMNPEPVKRKRDQIAGADIPQVIPHPRRSEPGAVAHRCKRRQGRGYQDQAQHPGRG